MVNPGAFRGSRYEFLREQKPTYAAAVADNCAADCLVEIQRRYFKRYPIDLEHNKEPSREHLDAVNDNAPDPEKPCPDPDAMSEEDYQLAMEAFDA